MSVTGKHMYGALDLGPLPRQQLQQKLLARQVSHNDRWKKEREAHERWAEERGYLQPRFHFGAPPGFPGSIEGTIRSQMRLGPHSKPGRRLGVSASLPELPVRRDLGGGSSGFANGVGNDAGGGKVSAAPPPPPAISSTVGRALGASPSAASIWSEAAMDVQQPLAPLARLPSLKHLPLPPLREPEPRRVPSREAKWNERLEAAKHGAGPDPIDMYIQRKHNRRYKSGGSHAEGSPPRMKGPSWANANLTVVVKGR